jgi:hypothetical protein
MMAFEDSWKDIATPPSRDLQFLPFTFKDATLE